jgi:transposase-like protein
MREIAGDRRRLGCRRIGVLLERKGITMTHKKPYRLYRSSPGSVGASAEVKTWKEHLMTRQRQRRGLPEAFEREAIERVRTSGLMIVAVARDPDVQETALRRWITRYGEPGTTSARRYAATAAARALSHAVLAAENARLKSENVRLQTERDIQGLTALIFGGATR